MPPPLIPQTAAGLASIVGETVIEITQRQGTGVSTSDVIRGVHKALRQGLVVVDYDIARRVCDEAHARAQHGDGHNLGFCRDGRNIGFCRACALIYEAVNAAVTSYKEVDGG